MAEGTKRGLTLEQWAELRKEYESGVSEAALSRKYGADRKTIRARRHREEWIPQVTPQVGKSEAEAIHQRAQSNVVDIATKRVVDRAAESGAIDRIVESIESSLHKHESIASQLMTAADDLIRDFNQSKDLDLASTREGEGRNVYVRQGRAEVFQQVVAGVKAAVAVSRDIGGLRPGMPSIPIGDDEKPAEMVEMVIIDPPKTGTHDA